MKEVFRNRSNTCWRRAGETFFYTRSILIAFFKAEKEQRNHNRNSEKPTCEPQISPERMRILLMLWRLRRLTLLEIYLLILLDNFPFILNDQWLLYSLHYQLVEGGLHLQGNFVLFSYFGLSLLFVISTRLNLQYISKI